MTWSVEHWAESWYGSLNSGRPGPLGKCRSKPLSRGEPNHGEIVTDRESLEDLGHEAMSDSEIQEDLGRGAVADSGTMDDLGSSSK